MLNVSSFQDSTKRVTRGSDLVPGAILIRDLAVFPSSPFLGPPQQVLEFLIPLSRRQPTDIPNGVGGFLQFFPIRHIRLLRDP
jgi:hypothetical protein